MKFGINADNDIVNNPLNFGRDPDHGPENPIHWYSTDHLSACGAWSAPAIGRTGHSRFFASLRREISVIPHIIDPAKSRVYVFTSIRLFVCLSVCLFVSFFVFNEITRKANGPILMKFGIMTDNDIGKNPLNFGHDSDLDPEEILSVSRV